MDSKTTDSKNDYIVQVFNHEMMLDNMEKGIMIEFKPTDKPTDEPTDEPTDKPTDKPIVEKIMGFLIKILIK